MILSVFERRFFGPERFADGNLKLGETFSVDSGLGGSFTVAYAGHVGGRLLFKRQASGDWPADDYWYEDDADAARHVFILVPCS